MPDRFSTGQIFVPDNPTGGPKPLWPDDKPIAPDLPPRNTSGIAHVSSEQSESGVQSLPEWWQLPPALATGDKYKQQVRRRLRLPRLLWHVATPAEDTCLWPKASIFRLSSANNVAGWRMSLFWVA